MLDLGKTSAFGRPQETTAMKFPHFSRVILALAFLAPILLLAGCEELVQNTQSVLLPRFQRSDLFGFIAGLGTTFAVLPDLIAMLRRRSTEGTNPRMAAIIGCFQILWIYYGILIVSRPVVVWNLIGVCINFFTVFAYRHLGRKARVASELRSRGA